MLKMSDSKSQNYNIIRVSDILEQVSELNKMIEIHKNNSDSSILAQYQEMKKEFVDELNSILKTFELGIKAA